MLYQIWGLIKLFYLYLLYFFVGLTEEEFYLPKGNYYREIGWYNAAIKSYVKALKTSNDPLTHCALGWCYSEIGNQEKAVEHMRVAYNQNDSAYFAINLAYSEYNAGNIKDFCKVFETINDKKQELTPDDQNEYNRLSKIWEKVSNNNV